MIRGYHADDHMFFVLDPERDRIIGYNGHLKVYHTRNNADRYAGHYGEIIEYAPIKYGRNVTQMNPVDEFICSECGFTTRDVSGYDAEDDVCYEFCPHFCPFYGDYDPGINPITGKCSGFIPHSYYDYRVTMKEYCTKCSVRGFDISSANPDPRRHKGDN